MEKKGFKYRISQLTEDKGSWWIQRIYWFGDYWLCFWSGIITKSVAKIIGVELGCRIDFYGTAHFNRSPKSKIVIGNDCRFRSSETSNLIGINHKCIIATLAKEARINIGNNCGMSGVSIGAAKEITIGNNVLVGANVIITDNDWHSSVYNSDPASVIIKDNVWIGVNSVILKGVEIGENSIIGACSLVTKSIPANVIAAGNPCKILKNIN